MPTSTHAGRFMSVPLCPGQSELACIFVFLSNLKTISIKLDKKDKKALDKIALLFKS